MVGYRKLTFSAMSPRSLSCSWDDLCNLGFGYKSLYVPNAVPCLGKNWGPVIRASVRRLSTTASSIRYSAFFGGSAMPAQHTRSTALLCGRPVALELSTRQLKRSGYWQGQLQTYAEDAFIYTVQKHLA